VHGLWGCFQQAAGLEAHTGAESLSGRARCCMPSMMGRAAFAASRLGWHSRLPPTFLRKTFLTLSPPLLPAGLLLLSSAWAVQNVVSKCTHSFTVCVCVLVSDIKCICPSRPSCRAALAEFRLGCPERGRSVFEGVLVNYTKRTDLWNVYLDQVCWQCVCVCGGG
jgi:hypothetical protein